MYEKINRKNWDGILLEYIESDVPLKKGWIETPKVCDFFCFGLFNENKAYIMLWEELVFAWHQNKDEWLSSYKQVHAQNTTYETKNVLVPFDEMLKHVKSFRSVDFVKDEKTMFGY